MKVIYKYLLQITTEQEIKIPVDFRILAVGEQFGDVFLWAIVNPDGITVSKKIFIFGTGHELPLNINNHPYVGTVITDSGNFVWHIFE